eukprot:CAMPEP_0185580298 /NCGR_PEP_ID=MMETSP0434-20130131/16056_1 /TAXON_ID=626734 ORGANISM="Favella taraikaensis, Strain Fe Narragansett Bay" /NCGR_SAMPLE_ID=MMETSP0434 /ASSEMBLY_ACC=CAM_ASM_000379 /LENGTH=147 /DNA_ID=CAMNT_0028198523 /DNA_START=27 /DNA_END=470 /DNA_ORIENTATION=+
MSGISVSDELLELYEQVKLRDAHKYILFSLKKQDDAGRTFDWAIDHRADKDTDIGNNKTHWDAMVSSLPEDSAMFVVFDFTFNKADGRLVKKLLLIKWCPDTVHFRVKPVIGATYQTLKDKLTGIAADVQCVDTDDLEYEAIQKLLA